MVKDSPGRPKFRRAVQKTTPLLPWLDRLVESCERKTGIETSQFPVERVTWNEAVEFVRKLSAEEGVEYRLPTEGE